MSGILGKPRIITPPPPAGIVQQEISTPTPVPTPNAPEPQQARRRQYRQELTRRGKESTILTSPQGLPSALGLTPVTNIGATLLGS